MTLVLDASVAVAALVDAGERGQWARASLREAPLAAPHLLPVETANALRRLVLAGTVSAHTAGAALRDLTDLGVELFPFEPFADRVWALRDAVTAYDAWYVALAEAYEVPFATLDERLVEAVGPRCDFVRYGGPGRFGR